jgi:hypothetical protein
MTDKSINASDRLEKQEKAWWVLLWGPVEARMRELGMYYPDSKPNTAPASGINPTHCTETKVQ